MSTIESSSNAASVTLIPGIVTIARPPALAAIPAPPPDYAQPAPAEFRGIVPRQGELTVLPQALLELSTFESFDRTLGATAPTQAEARQALEVAAEWSAMCQAADAWAAYARAMQGLAWRQVRTQMASMRPAFALAAKRNPKLEEQYAALATLLAAPSTITLKGAATKKANAKAIAEGRAPTHGAIGKRRQRAAEKAALAAKGEAPT